MLGNEEQHTYERAVHEAKDEIVDNDSRFRILIIRSYTTITTLDLSSFIHYLTVVMRSISIFKRYMMF